MKQLVRPLKNRMIGGVCAGIAQYFNLDPTLVRLIWVLLTLLSFGFGGVVAYIIAWIIMPDETS